MQIWQAIVLGFTQGFTEFLPVSSSGHLALMQKFLGLDAEKYLLFDLALHLATLIPVIFAFRKSIFKILRPPFNGVWLILIATIPAVVIGLTLGDLVENAFGNIYFLIFGFFVTAIILFVAETVYKSKRKFVSPTVKTSLITGFAQALAVFPAFSRSGLTISTGCLLGVNKSENAEFSFLMSIPIILGGCIIKGVETVSFASIPVGVLPLVLGMFSAFISGYISVSLMVEIIKKANFKVFSIYLIILSLALLILSLCKVI